MDLLIQVLIGIVIVAIVAWGMYFTCTKFFPEFPPARWICGVVLLILILVAASHMMGTGPSILPHRG